ncbi:MAG TPA: hypothetical protein PLO37_12435 [Candidatus Hydrogenedentes bacterium]|nr:hypothetical protein [Candidatus Hydrogenedentota bacterium]HPG67649.1 hypothetical protein [Candidatus Hydrogenedentota bacterium]
MADTTQMNEAPQEGEGGATGSRRRIHRAVRYALYCTVASYILVELAFSTLYTFGLVFPPPPFSLVEGNGGGYRFDPIRGFWLLPQPSRWARIADGRPQYVGCLRGNDQGFPDRDHVGPQRQTPGRRRIAVFGDSFTAAQFLGLNWPDRAEDLARQAGEDVQLLNLAVDGGGLVNWWSICTKLLDADHYELDGVVFAVYDAMFGELDRPFALGDTCSGQRALRGYVDCAEHQSLTESFEQARPYLSESEEFIVPSNLFELALDGKWRPDLPRPWRLRLAAYACACAQQLIRTGTLPQLFSALSTCLGNPIAYADALSHLPENIRQDISPWHPLPLSTNHLRLAEDIHAYLVKKGLPALVVVIAQPMRPPIPPSTKVRQFAEVLGAQIVDGRDAFDGLDRDQIAALWLEHDGHWNQAGSDRFAAYMGEVLQNWPPSPSDANQP